MTSDNVLKFPCRPMPPSVKQMGDNMLRLQGHPKVAAEVSGKLAAFIEQLRDMNYIVPDDWKGL